MIKRNNSAPIYETNRSLVKKQILESKKMLLRHNNKLLKYLDLPKDDKHKNEEQLFIRNFDITHFGLNSDVNISNLWIKNEQRNNYINICIHSFLDDLEKMDFEKIF